jgi:hypothetical protein
LLGFHVDYDPDPPPTVTNDLENRGFVIGDDSVTCSNLHSLLTTSLDNSIEMSLAYRSGLLLIGYLHNVPLSLAFPSPPNTPHLPTMLLTNNLNNPYRERESKKYFFSLYFFAHD